MIAVAIALSMIVEMTSLTPRVTFRTPAMPAHTAPVPMAHRMISGMEIQPGVVSAPPRTAAKNAAMRYWPSTPMLNRFIRKPMATATPAR